MTHLGKCGLLSSLLLVASGIAGCDECRDRPPPCADESFYELAPPAEPDRPSGLATVTVVGRDAVRMMMSETGEEATFRSLPAVPSLEPGDEVLIEGSAGAYRVSRGGALVFFTGRGPTVYGAGTTQVAGVDVDLVPFCRRPVSGGDDQCFYGTTVFSVGVGGEEVEPGTAREVELPDGRRATFRNRLINRGTSSCPRCLDLPASNFLVDVVFH